MMSTAPEIVGHLTVLAAPPGGQEGANTFLDSGAGQALQKVCGAVSLIILVSCIFSMVRYFTRGNHAQGFKIITGGLVIGGLLFNLSLTVTGIQTFSGIIGKVFESLDSLVG
jgi:hypothetical protein